MGDGNDVAETDGEPDASVDVVTDGEAETMSDAVLTGVALTLLLAEGDSLADPDGDCGTLALELMLAEPEADGGAEELKAAETELHGVAVSAREVVIELEPTGVSELARDGDDEGESLSAPVGVAAALDDTPALGDAMPE
jgi:hypothetical protein